MLKLAISLIRIPMAILTLFKKITSKHINSQLKDCEVRQNETVSDNLEVKVKITQYCFEAMKSDFKNHAPNESILFLVARKIEEKNTLLYLVTRVITLNNKEAIRERFGVRPTQDFSRGLYTYVKKDCLAEKGYRLITAHSHPFCDKKVQLSSIDEATMRNDARIHKDIFGETIDFGQIVFNADLTDFDGYIVWPDRRLPIKELTIIGKGIQKIKPKQNVQVKNPITLSRTVLIPTFNYEKLSNIKIGLIGCGGLGSCMAVALVLEGFAENNTLVFVDHDRFEETNLGRIPTANFGSVGEAKVHAIERYINWIRPNRKVIAVQDECFSQHSQEELLDCDLIISGVDSELARLAMDHFASSFMIPLLDLGSGVIVDEMLGKTVVIQSGQARLFVPGLTPCLLCTMGINSERLNNELARKFINHQEKAILKQSGYLHNLTDLDIPQPSVYSLNNFVSSVGMSLLKRFLLEGKVDDNWYAANFGEASILKLSSKSNENCPVCGKDASIGDGLFFDINAMRNNRDNLPMPSFEPPKLIESENIPDQGMPLSEEQEKPKNTILLRIRILLGKMMIILRKPIKIRR